MPRPNRIDHDTHRVMISCLPFRAARLAGAGLLTFLLVLGGCAGADRTADAGDDDEAQPPARTVVPSEIPESVPIQGESAAATTGVDLDTVRAGRFDMGKMWTFENPPTAYFREAYGFAPDDAWWEKARLGALRIPGCTASFVSPHGLMLTNHHCGRDHVVSVTREGEALLDEGFYAASLDEERRVPGLYADQLIALRDVTDEVEASVRGLETPAERAQARQEAFGRIQERIAREFGGEGQGIEVQVISLYDGGAYSAYVFRRYQDVRLVLAPEQELGYFGGDPDNFTYPRYTLDMTIFRVYGDDGEPLRPEAYFAWSDEGAEPGDAVFVVGNPGSTSRLQTVAQLEYRRDVETRAISAFVDNRVEALRAYQEARPSAITDETRNQLFSLLNAQKYYGGSLKALRDPYIIARRRAGERTFVEAVEADPELRAEYGTLVEEMAEVQREKRRYADEFTALLGLSPTYPYSSALLRRAFVAHTLLERQRAGADAGAVEGLRGQLLGIQDLPAELEERYLTARLRMIAEAFEEDDALVQEILGGRSPEDAAEAIVAGSALADSASLARALDAGTLAGDDPALALAEALAPRYRAYQSAFAGLGARESEIAARIGRAKFEVYGTDVPPDATFSLRIADGVVAGYPYNGTIAPPYTTYYGLYDHYYSYGGEGTEWDLPARWLTPPEAFDLSTPLNLVSTNDIIGGNSGSPLLNRDLEVVGLVFDGNIESLVGDFIYLTDRARTVSVDARGMLEALDDMYEADRIVRELVDGELFETEQDADAAAGR